MASYTQKDFEWVRGTTPRIGFVFRKRTGGTPDEPVWSPVDFDDVIFTLYKGAKGGTLVSRYSLEDGDIIVTDEEIGQVEWTLRAHDTRALTESPIGGDPKNRYEVELRKGTNERVYVLGFITAIGGINSDEDDTDAQPAPEGVN